MKCRIHSKHAHRHMIQHLCRPFSITFVTGRSWFCALFLMLWGHFGGDYLSIMLKKVNMIWSQFDLPIKPNENRVLKRMRNVKCEQCAEMTSNWLLLNDNGRSFGSVARCWFTFWHGTLFTVQLRVEFSEQIVSFVPIARLIAACKKIEVEYFAEKAEHQYDSSAAPFAYSMDEINDSGFRSSNGEPVNVEQLYGNRECQQLRIVEEEDFISMVSTCDSCDDEDTASIDSNETLVATTSTSFEHLN